MTTEDTKRIEFKAEIQQVLDILIHSLYTEKEIFLRELVSNASDALSRYKLESLTSDQGSVTPHAELGIWIEGDPETRTLTVRDTGIGMTEDDMVKTLGTIAHSGAKSFVETMAQVNGGKAPASADLIGQFGVGFYSVFMVADEVRVTSRSYRPEAAAAFWRSEAKGSYEVGAAEKKERGTEIVVKLKEEAGEFAEPQRLRHIIKTHSDFVAYPIYLKEKNAEGEGEWVQVNQQTALWREQASSIAQEDYAKFYRQLTFDFAEPLRTVHFRADMPLQFFALLFIPSKRNYKLLGNSEDYGLKLYARKVLIQEHFKALLPPYLRFIEGVVDSEDLPLNVSRETVQTSASIRKIKKALVGRLANELKTMAQEDASAFEQFYEEFGLFLKEGVATDPDAKERFAELLRFNSSRRDGLVSLQDYLDAMKDEQAAIYYIVGDDPVVVATSSHLEYFRKHGLEVLYFTDPVDAFMLMGLSEYGGKPLQNIDDAELELPASELDDATSDEQEETLAPLLEKVKTILGERVETVRLSKVLDSHPARLVNTAGVAGNVQRVQRLMGQDTGLPKRIFELNPRHELVKNLAARLDDDGDDLAPLLVEQLFDNELLMEGLHPNPAEMIPRLEKLMAAANSAKS